MKNVKTEKKLIAFAAIALIVGVASITPLMFLMSQTAKAQTFADEPWFTASIPYSYWVPTTGTEDLNPQINFSQGRPSDLNNETNLLAGNLTDQEFVGYRKVIVMNFTLKPLPETETADAKIEYYVLEVKSDKGPVMNMSYYVGTARSNSFEPGDFHFMRNNWFDSNTTGGGGFDYSWASGTSKLWPIRGSGTGTPGHSGSGNVYTALTEAETLTINLSRLGWVTFNGNSTTVKLSNELIQQIQLNKYGDGFLYNTMFNEDELSQIDLWIPFDY